MILKIESGCLAVITFGNGCGSFVTVGDYIGGHERLWSLTDVSTKIENMKMECDEASLLRVDGYIEKQVAKIVVERILERADMLTRLVKVVNKRGRNQNA